MSIWEAFARTWSATSSILGGVECPVVVPTNPNKSASASADTRRMLVERTHAGQHTARTQPTEQKLLTCFGLFERKLVAQPSNNCLLASAWKKISHRLSRYLAFYTYSETNERANQPPGTTAIIDSVQNDFGCPTTTAAAFCTTKHGSLTGTHARCCSVNAAAAGWPMSSTEGTV